MNPRRFAAAVVVLLALLSTAFVVGQVPVGEPTAGEGSADVDEPGVLLRPLEAIAPGFDPDRRPQVSAPAPQVPPLLPAIDDLDETVVTITTSAGDRVRVDAKVAATTEEQRNGLMHVPDLPPGVGMLFVFANERSGGFWMFNTLVPLDIAYIDNGGRIGTILPMDPCGSDDPGDCPAYPPDRPYSTALEVPQGWFAEVGVSIGDRVRWTDPVPAG
jgi:uncharacterized protein